VNEESVRVRAP